ncbi:MAG: AAA family ATPase [Miltoncostaeaceae bacterium]
MTPPQHIDPDAPARAEVAETHISVITMIGDRAYKLLKPIATGFLDHRAREDRREACRQETEANRRFAPDVYLGVLDVVDQDGQPLEHLIEMRRLPAHRALGTLLDQPGAEGRVREVGTAVAALHRDSPRSREIDRAGRPEVVRALWEDGLDELAAAAPGVVPGDEVERARALARTYLDGRGPLFTHRIALDRVRDGHGDLLADDIYLLDDGPRVLDCLAFDDRLRHGDVLLDVASLAMDLATRDRADLAQVLLDEWSSALDEEHPRSLRDHYMAYRAHVRSKVAAIRSAQGDAAAGDTARSLHAFATGMLDRAQVRLVLVGGAPGTGKSTVAAGLGHVTGAGVVRSDAVRKRLAGLDPEEAAPAPWREGHYTQEVTERVYAEMLRRAESLLEHGQDVVLDASWSAAPHREAARRLAERCGARIVELRCEVAPAVAAARIEERGRRGGDPSDATPDVAERLSAASDPWPSSIALPTDAAPAEVAADAARHVGVTRSLA